jgi:hypothetical protein
MASSGTSIVLFLILFYYLENIFSLFIVSRMNLGNDNLAILEIDGDCVAISDGAFEQPMRQFGNDVISDDPCNFSCAILWRVTLDGDMVDGLLRDIEDYALVGDSVLNLGNPKPDDIVDG